ncbi:MAG: undecaprenyl-phosphate glucose phosphotransferase [Bacteroidota bacterium]|nr:undecaprenyl-phosphate glucose phosphotransferase [Bacteroidota bacterium]
MIYSSSRYVKVIHLAIDFLLLNFAFFDGYFLKFGNLNLFQDNSYFLFIIYFNLVWFIGGNYLGTFNFNPFLGVENVFRILIQLFGIHILFLSFFWVFIKGFYFSREHLILVYTILFILMLFWKMGLFYFLKFYRKQWFRFKSVLVVGYGESAKELAMFFKKFPEYGYRFLGFITEKESKESDDIIGQITDLQSITENIQVDEIFCSMPDATALNLDTMYDFCDDHLIRLRIVPDFRRLTNKNLLVDLFEGVPVLSFRKLPLDDPLNRFAKRAFDVFFSSLVMIFILSWLFPILALIIKLTSRGPIFFRQKRTGKDGLDFWCYKFRSMYVNKESDKVQAKKGDNRITPIGAFIRKTSLDEFPQFINVFLGNMSIVGPRPHMLKHTEEYSQIIRKYMVRHFVKPGITGLAQTKGFRGETKDPKKMQGRVKMDIFYIENWSFLLDLKIIVLTVFNIIQGEENAG